MIKKFLISFLVYLLSLSLYSNSMANEEAPYDVVHNNDIYEVRYYSDRLVVQVMSKDNNNSFRKLFRYISGANKKSTKISMTVPVTQTTEDNETYMQFYLPSKFSKETVPAPTNPEVKISTIKEGFFAVIRYSGRASDTNFDKHSKILEKKLNEDNVSMNGLPIKATYDSPFTLPLLRRNEAMINVEWNKN